MRVLYGLEQQKTDIIGEHASRDPSHISGHPIQCHVLLRDDKNKSTE